MFNGKFTAGGMAEKYKGLIPNAGTGPLYNISREKENHFTAETSFKLCSIRGTTSNRSPQMP